MNNSIKKGVAITIILLFISVSVAQSIGLNITENNTRIIPCETEETTTSTTNHNGSLSGYVNDTYMNPIEGALVRVYFHGTYEENYTDSSGYYHVTNIPLCWCVKNATASKEGYKTEWVWLVIRENTTYDFVLTPIDPHCYPVFDGTMGENGWYVSCVKINFTTDDNVSTVYYSIDNGSWQTFAGVPIIVCDDGLHIFCWYYVDNEGNESAIECIEFKIDQTPPEIDITWQLTGNPIKGWKFITNAYCEDYTSGVERVDFYHWKWNGYYELYVDFEEPYEWESNVFIKGNCSVKGLIFFPWFYNEYVSFIALFTRMYGDKFGLTVVGFDNAGNRESDQEAGMINNTYIYMFQRFTFLNNYSGKIGLFFIDAVFKNIPIEEI